MTSLSDVLGLHGPVITIRQAPLPSGDLGHGLTLVAPQRTGERGPQREEHPPHPSPRYRCRMEEILCLLILINMILKYVGK